MRVSLFGVGVLAAGMVLWTSAMRPRASDRWIETMRARGEVFTFEELGLDRPSPVDPVLEVLDQSVGQLQVLHQAAVPVSVRDMSTGLDGVRRVNWREPRLVSHTGGVLDWEVAMRLADELGPVVRGLHAALREPRRDPGMDYLTGTPRNAVGQRTAAAVLRDLVHVELHRGDLEAAHANLLTLLRTARMHEDEWTVVNQMIRTVMLGMAIDTLWDALQAPGWTDLQLAALQVELEQVRILPHLARIYEVMRIESLLDLDDYAREGPSRFVSRRSRQWRIPATQRPPAWLEHAAFVMWRLARGDRDRTRLLVHYQRQIERHRALASGVPFLMLGPAPQPTGSWWSRFQLAWDLFPLRHVPNFDRATEHVVAVETRRRMAIVALALERYRLGNGHYPETLEELVPGLIEELPQDPISGQPLCYRRQSETTFALASAWVMSPPHLPISSVSLMNCGTWDTPPARVRQTSRSFT